MLSFIIFLKARLSAALYRGVGQMGFPGKLTIDIVTFGRVPGSQESIGLCTHLREWWSILVDEGICFVPILSLRIIATLCGVF